MGKVGSLDGSTVGLLLSGKDDFLRVKGSSDMTPIILQNCLDKQILAGIMGRLAMSVKATVC